MLAPPELIATRMSADVVFVGFHGNYSRRSSNPSQKNPLPNESQNNRLKNRYPNPKSEAE